MSVNWKNRPTLIEHWEDANADTGHKIDYIMFIDESGTADLSYVNKRIKRNQLVGPENAFLVISGCIISYDHFPQIRDSILELKNKYWPSGLYNARRVVLHGKDIRHKKKPFDDLTINYENFLDDLYVFLDNQDFTIITSVLNKAQYLKIYTDLQSNYPNKVFIYHPYKLSLCFVIERFQYFLQRKNKLGVIVCESRGNKEDHKLLKDAIDIIDGTLQLSQRPKRRIKGVYFNPKFSVKHENKKSYFGLEIADLVAYITNNYYNMGRNFNCGLKHMFSSFEKKHDNYPKHLNYGIKFFP